MKRQRGFTLMEMLVVVGIIVLLGALLFPMIVKIKRNASRARTRGDLNAIAAALEAYRADFNDYPRVPGPGNPGQPQYQAGPTGPGTTPTPPAMRMDGALMLCWALMGPRPAFGVQAGTDPNFGGDGADGPGFRAGVPLAPGVILSGKVWGPYLPPEKFKMADPFDGNQDTQAHNNRHLALIDHNGFTGPDSMPGMRNFPVWSAILYFPASPAKPKINPDPAQPSVNINRATATTGTSAAYGYFNINDTVCMYDVDDGRLYFRRAGDANTLNAEARLRVTAGDLNNDGYIDTAAGEEALASAPFILWAPGPDGRYGIEGTTATATATLAERNKLIQKCDDVISGKD